MLQKLSATLVAFVLLFGVAVPASAQSQTKEAQQIRQLLEERDRDLKRVLGSKTTFTDAQRAELKEQINDIIDFRAMSRIALGPHWKDLEQAQREEFVAVFSDIVRAQSLSNLDVYRSSVAYDKIVVEGDSAFVRTTTTYKDTPTKVDYVLGRTEEEWLAHDIILDGVSTAEGYARSFQTVIRKKGFETLMKSLRKKQAQVTTASN